MSAGETLDKSPVSGESVEEGLVESAAWSGCSASTRAELPEATGAACALAVVGDGGAEGVTRRLTSAGAAASTGGFGFSVTLLWTVG
jgi:hypothetical protein